MGQIRYLEPEEPFPPTAQALDEPNGLLAAGADLSPERLVDAYRRGIFPWFEQPQPILWWTPEPRSVLFPQQFHLSRSLRKTLRREIFTLSVDQHFGQVMQLCGKIREDNGDGTWIGSQMLRAYQRLFELGIAHSIEVHNRAGELAGGLYGLAIGSAFFGESMFSLETDASKVAFAGLVHLLNRAGFDLIDCQLESAHLSSLGARPVSRLDFETLLAQTVDKPIDSSVWQIAPGSGALL